MHQQVVILLPGAFLAAANLPPSANLRDNMVSLYIRDIQTSMSQN